VSAVVSDGPQRLTMLAHKGNQPALHETVACLFAEGFQMEQLDQAAPLDTFS
jgi:hypothetical protein